jgi:hypothetical protein
MSIPLNNDQNQYFTLLSSKCIGMNKNECSTFSNDCQWKSGPVRQFCSAKYSSLKKNISPKEIENIWLFCSKGNDSSKIATMPIIYKNNRKNILHFNCRPEESKLNDQNINSNLDPPNYGIMGDYISSAAPSIINSFHDNSQSYDDFNFLNEIVIIPNEQQQPPSYQNNDNDNVDQSSQEQEQKYETKTKEKWIDKCAGPNHNTKESVINFIENETQFNIAQESLNQGFPNPFKFRPLAKLIERSQGKILCFIVDFLLLYNPHDQQNYIFANNIDKDPRSIELYQWYTQNMLQNPNLNNLNNLSSTYQIDPDIFKIILYNNQESDLGGKNDKSIFDRNADVDLILNLNYYGLKDILDLYNAKTHDYKKPSIINPINNRLTQLFDPIILSKWNVGTKIFTEFEYNNFFKKNSIISEAINHNNFRSFGHFLSVMENLINNYTL